MDFKTLYKTILYEYEQVFEKVDRDGLREFIDTVKKHDRVFLIGVGVKGLQQDHLPCG